MSKWNLNNPLVYSYLKNALIGIESINGEYISPYVISQLDSLFCFNHNALYSKGAATIFPYPSGIISDVLNKRFIDSPQEDIDQIINTLKINPIPSSHKKVIEKFGLNILFESYNPKTLFKVFIPNLAKALQYELS